MERKEIKQMQREIIYRKLFRFARMSGQGASNTFIALAGGLVVAGGLSLPFIVAGIFN